MTDSHNTSHTALAHHFDDMEQQKEASTVGMWVFLLTEILFFGGLFAAYLVYRSAHPDVFVQASHHLDMVLGGVNTAVLLLSSLTVALAVHAAQEGHRKQIIGFLTVTIVLAGVFLVIKSFEYAHKFHEGTVPGTGFHVEGIANQGVAEMFYVLYFAMTGLHALHVIVGIGILSVIAFKAYRGRFSAEYYTPVEVSGLYWHFVDIVWIFLYPLLYLIH
jgi:cytochrome c oxidase subunit 3